MNNAKCQPLQLANILCDTWMTKADKNRILKINFTGKKKLTSVKFQQVGAWNFE